MEDDVLAARIEDAARLCEARSYPRFVGFLDERQAALAKQIAQKLRIANYLLWGGYEDAQRVMFGVFPDWQQPDGDSFPVAVLHISFRKEDALSHRDFLGTLMAQGISRETVGDILVEEGRGVLFVKEEIASYIKAQVTKIGGAGIAFLEQPPASLPQGRGFEELSGTVASARLDCVLSVLLKCSREKCASLIAGGLITLNYEIALSPSARVEPEDRLSAKGYGKFIVDQIGPPTKKGRLHLAARKYK